MFDQLTERLDSIFANLKRRGKLSEKDVDQAMREIRLALLEADVQYGVVKDFVSRVKERAVGQEVSRALNPGQQVVKIVHEELIQTLGQPVPLSKPENPPQVVMLVGLQGAGKTTAAGKLARMITRQDRKALLVAADPYRPAAVAQLQTLGEQIQVPVAVDPDLPPAALAQQAVARANFEQIGMVIIDTAGRSQLDGELMEELQAINSAVNPSDVLLVVDAMIGQEAVNVARGFRDSVPLTGLVMTKMDGDARGGAAISIRSVTGVPIKFLGTGEQLNALEVYNPDRLASRILGMGDVIGLIQQAEEAVDQDQAQRQAQKMISGEFTLEDFAKQLAQVRKMGPIGKLMEMMPGEMGKMARDVPPQDLEANLRRTEAIILSMTPEERYNPKILNASRRKRIAAGSGTRVYDINQLIKQYRAAHKMFKELNKSGLGNLTRLLGS